jgi:DNA-binding GntR family transcriptional regulator
MASSGRQGSIFSRPPSGGCVATLMRQMEASPKPVEPHDDALGDGVDALHERLRGDILDGRLAPGSGISQVQLSQEYGVSRTKLREAMRMLVHEGLIELRPRGARVADVSAQDLDELYAQRLLLETLGLRQSVPKLTPEEVADLEGMLAKMAHFERVGDYARWDRPHRDFHALLVSRAGPRTRTAIEQLADHAMRYRKLFHTEATARAAADAEHRAILDAVIDRDAERATVELARHLARTPLAVLDAIAPGHEPEVMRDALHELTGDEQLPSRSG